MICNRKGCDRLASKALGIEVVTPCEKHGSHRLDVVMSVVLCDEHGPEFLAEPVGKQVRTATLRIIAGISDLDVEVVAQATTRHILIDLTPVIEAGIDRSQGNPDAKPWVH